MYIFLLFFGVFLWITVLAVYLRRPCASAFHPVTFMLFFQAVVFVIRPVLAYIQDFNGLYFAYDFTPTQVSKVNALLVADLGFLVFSAAAIWSGDRPLTIKVPRIDGVASRRLLPPFLTSVIVSAPIPLWSLISSINERAYNTSTMVLDSSTGVSVNTSGNGYFASASISLATIVVVFAWLNRFRLWSLLPFCGYVVFKGASGGRFPFVMATGSLLLLYLWEGRRRWTTWRVVAAGFAVVLFFGAVGQDRGAAIRAMFYDRPTEPADVFAQRPLESMDYGSMEFVEYLVQTIPARTGTYDYFLDNLILFTGPIPRQLWPSKPIGEPIKRFYLFDYGNPIGMTNTMPGEGWFAWGWLGVITWCGLAGYVFGRIYNAFMASRQTTLTVSMYMVTAPLTLLFFRDGSLPELVVIVSFEILPILLWILVDKMWEPSGSGFGRGRQVRRLRSSEK